MEVHRKKQAQKPIVIMSRKISRKEMHEDEENSVGTDKKLLLEADELVNRPKTNVEVVTNILSEYIKSSMTYDQVVKVPESQLTK